MSEKRLEQGEEFRAWVFSFDYGEVQFTTQLVKSRLRRACSPRRNWHNQAPRQGMIVIGFEALIIGEG